MSDVKAAYEAFSVKWCLARQQHPDMSAMSLPNFDFWLQYVSGFTITGQVEVQARLQPGHPPASVKAADPAAPESKHKYDDVSSFLSIRAFSK